LDYQSIPINISYDIYRGNMSIPEFILKHKGQFVGRPIKMGKKTVVIIPTEFHKGIDKVMNKLLKFEWEEVLDSNGKRN
jgi:hypothetical protein